MKRLPFLALLLLLSATPAFAVVKVVTSLQDFASIADSIGGNRVETFAIAKGYQDPHFVDPKPSFVLKLNRADLLIVAGLDLEIGYIRPLIDQSRNERLKPIKGQPPSLIYVPSGCPFNPRCPHVMERCRVERPLLQQVQPNRWVACHLYDGAA